MSNVFSGLLGAVGVGAVGASNLIVPNSGTFSTGSTYTYPKFFVDESHYTSLNLWSSQDLPRDLSDKDFRLFMRPLGPHNPSIRDTNMRESGRVGSAFLCTHVSWVLHPTPCDSDIEQLAGAFAKDAEIEQKLIFDAGTLHWDLVQTQMDIGPLWLRAVPYRLVLQEHATFAVLLRFGSNVPLLDRGYSLRVALTGYRPSQPY